MATPRCCQLGGVLHHPSSWPVQGTPAPVSSGWPQAAAPPQPRLARAAILQTCFRRWFSKTVWLPFGQKHAIGNACPVALPRVLGGRAGGAPIWVKLMQCVGGWQATKATNRWLGFFMAALVGGPACAARLPCGLGVCHLRAPPALAGQNRFFGAMAPLCRLQCMPLQLRVNLWQNPVVQSPANCAVVHGCIG